VVREKLSEIAVDREVFRVLLGLLPLTSLEEKRLKLNECYILVLLTNSSSFSLLLIRNTINSLAYEIPASQML